MRTLRQMARKVGRRGAALAWLGGLDLVIGWSLLMPRPVPPSYQALARLAPLEAWAWAWIAVGLVCLAHAPARSDRLGFAAAITVKAVWAVFIAGAWLAYDVPLGWVPAAVWASFAAFVLLVAGWPEPGRPPDA